MYTYMKGFNSFSCVNRYQVPTAAITPYQIRQMLEMNLLNLPLCLQKKSVLSKLFYFIYSLQFMYPFLKELCARWLLPSYAQNANREQHKVDILLIYFIVKSIQVFFTFFHLLYDAIYHTHKFITHINWINKYINNRVLRHFMFNFLPG